MIYKQRIKNKELEKKLEELCYSPIEVGILSSRCISTTEELNLKMLDLKVFIDENLSRINDIEKATDIIISAIKNNKNIIVAGDYDCDGATSTSLVITALKMMGCKNVNFVIPDRVIMGYGLTENLVNIMPTETNLIITVDNGIAAFSGVDYAKSLGMQVVVTDHHLQPENCPLVNGDAVLNPNRIDCEFPDKNIAGVGVAFLLIYKINEELDKQGWYKSQNIEKLRMIDFLDFVALGTVADVVKLSYLNQMFVVNGLKIINTNPRTGFKALIEACGLLEKNYISTVDVAFTLAPKINAAGRISDMSKGIQLLTNETYTEALNIASELYMVNKQRKDIEDDIKKELLEQIDQEYKIVESFSVIAYNKDWHEGVIGIVAGRLKDKFNKPSIVFTDAHEEDLIKGSCRSISGFNIRDALANIDSENKGLISRFGGHAMAAGLTLDKSKLELFKDLFNKEYIKVFGKNTTEKIIYYDDIKGKEKYNLDTIKLLDRKYAWGNGFESPVYYGEFLIKGVKPLCEGKHYKLLVEDLESNFEIEAMVFENNFDPYNDIFIEGLYIKMLYVVNINSYRGKEKSQIVVTCIIST